MATKQTTVQQRIATAIREAYPLPERIEFLRRIATTDLWHGPVSSGPDSPYNPDPETVTPETWTGFPDACAELDNWAGENVPNQLWYDDDCGMLMQSQPEGFEDEDGEYVEPGEYYEIDRRDIRSALFPRQLHEYL